MWYGITLSIGIILLIIGFVKLNQSITFIKSGEKATAKVFELETISSTDGGPTYKPIFKFKTRLNQEYIYRHISSSSPPNWAIGDEAELIYDPVDPTKAKLLTYFGSFSWTIVLIAIAMPLITIGGGYYLSKMFFRQI